MTAASRPVSSKDEINALFLLRVLQANSPEKSTVEELVRKKIAEFEPTARAIPLL